MIGYSTVTQKGQITVPAAIRKNLGLHPNQKVIIIKQGTFTIKMEERIIALSQGMGLYQERGILSKASIEKVELRPSFNDPLCLMITTWS